MSESTLPQRMRELMPVMDEATTRWRSEYPNQDVPWSVSMWHATLKQWEAVDADERESWTLANQIAAGLPSDVEVTMHVLYGIAVGLRADGWARS